MDIKFVDKKKMIVVGLVASGSNIEDIDIYQLWANFEQICDKIKHEVPGKDYEIHIENDDFQPREHYCIAGVEVDKVEDVPAEMFVKIVPAAKYAVYTHQFKDGGFTEAFKNIYTWLEKNNYSNPYSFDIQCYDNRFKGADNPNSELEIYIPIE